MTVLPGLTAKYLPKIAAVKENAFSIYLAKFYNKKFKSKPLCL
jgi:hypothetical protein